MTISCKDIGEITMNEEVRQALKNQFDLIELQESAVKLLKEASGEHKPP